MAFSSTHRCKVESPETEMDMGRVVKVEVDIGPEVLQLSDMRYLVMLEPKVEPDIEDSLCDSEELDVSPVVLKPPCCLLKLEPKVEPGTEDWGSSQEPSLLKRLLLSNDVEISRRSELARRNAAAHDSNMVRCNEESRETELDSGGAVMVEVEIGPEVQQPPNTNCLVNLEPEVELDPRHGQCKEEIQSSGSSNKSEFWYPNTNNQNNIYVKQIDKSNCSKINEGKITKRPYKCTKCDKSFVRRDNLRSHMQIHSGIKPYKCTECDKSFFRVFSLKCHMQSHTGFKPYKCTDCGKSFPCLSKLTLHMHTHTGTKPYKCSECVKAFTQSGYLTIHMRSHTGLKPYKCSKCYKAYTRSSYLKYHLMRFHQ